MCLSQHMRVTLISVHTALQLVMKTLVREVSAFRAWHGTARWSRHTQVQHGSDVLPLLRLGAVTHQGWWSRLRRHKLCSLLHCSRLWRHVMRLSGESEATALGSSMRMCTHGANPRAYRAPYGQAALLVSQPATQTCTQYGCVQRHGRPAS